MPQRARGSPTSRWQRGASAPELGHVAEHGDAARPAGALDERRERGPHRERVRVVGVVDHDAAAGRGRSWPRSGESSIAPAPAPSPSSGRPSAGVRRGGSGEVGGVVRRAQVGA